MRILREQTRKKRRNEIVSLYLSGEKSYEELAEYYLLRRLFTISLVVLLRRMFFLLRPVEADVLFVAADL